MEKKKWNFTKKTGFSRKRNANSQEITREYEIFPPID